MLRANHFAAAGILLCAGIAVAQVRSDRDTQTGATAAGVARQADQQMNDQLRQFAQDPKTAFDKLFVLHASVCKMEEVELARQVAQKTSNPTIKQLAQRIAEDHQRANQQLQPIAQQLGVQLPSSLPPEMQQINQILLSQPTDQMEKHFVVMMQAGHAQALVQYRGCAELSQNDQIKQYAQQQLPALTQHSEQVQQAALALGLPAGTGEAVPASGRFGPTGTPGGTTPPEQPRRGTGAANEQR